jgi:hypothetical protein
LIPPPRKNLTRYHGVFAPAHPHRSLIVPAVARANPGCHRNTQAHADDAPPATAAHHRRLPWALRLRRCFAIDVLRCRRCGDSMTIIAVIGQSPTSDAILDHLGLELPKPQVHLTMPDPDSWLLIGVPPPWLTRTG